jgi:tetratricopeptide (TPR) repeat protein
MGNKIKNLDEYTEKTLRGAELFNENKYPEALEIFLQLADYNKKNFKVYETLAMIYLKLNDFSSAHDAYKKARELFAEQSSVKMELKTFDEAVNELESVDKLEALYDETAKKETEDNAGERNPEIHKLPVMISLHYMSKGDYKKAEDLLVGHKEKFFK